MMCSCGTVTYRMLNTSIIALTFITIRVNGGVLIEEHSNPGPQNTFWQFVQNCICVYICTLQVAIFERFSPSLEQKCFLKFLQQIRFPKDTNTNYPRFEGFFGTTV